MDYFYLYAECCRVTVGSASFSAFLAEGYQNQLLRGSHEEVLTE